MLDGFDPVQVSLLKEECILVDENDKVVGTGSKKECHLMSNIREGKFDWSLEHVRIFELDQKHLCPKNATAIRRDRFAWI